MKCHFKLEFKYWIGFISNFNSIFQSPNIESYLIVSDLPTSTKSASPGDFKYKIANGSDLDILSKTGKSLQKGRKNRNFEFEENTYFAESVICTGHDKSESIIVGQLECLFSKKNQFMNLSTVGIKELLEKKNLTNRQAPLAQNVG
jgi:hypothetical protein